MATKLENPLADEAAPDLTGPESMTRRAYMQLKQDIIAGRLPPGLKLKIELLRRQYDMGASPIREALSLLTSDFLVERLDQRGFRVAKVSEAEFFELLKTRCWLEERALRESIQHGSIAWEEKVVLANYRLMRLPRAGREHSDNSPAVKIRTVQEQTAGAGGVKVQADEWDLAGRSGANRDGANGDGATTDRSGELRADQNPSGQSRSDQGARFMGEEQWEAAHKQFHMTLIAECGSSILLKICDQLYDQNIRYRQLSSAQAYPRRDVVEEHNAICDAVLARDPVKAVQLLLEHYRYTGQFVHQELSGGG